MLSAKGNKQNFEKNIQFTLSGLAEAALTGLWPGCAFAGRRVTISSSLSSELAASPLLPLPAFPVSCCCCLLRLRGGLLRSIPVSSSLEGGWVTTLLLPLLLLLSLTVDSRERFACGSRIRTPDCCGCDLTARLLLAAARGEGREGRPSSESSVPPRGSMTWGMVLT
jgi:hypothetical protein